ncbi:hypothetical protein WDW89_24780 [Deltaproteobacteria bacterium TL4]
MDAMILDQPPKVVMREETSDQFKMLEILKHHNPRVLKKGSSSIIKFGEGIEMHFENEKLERVVNTLKADDRLNYMNHLYERLCHYFTDMFPQMKNYDFSTPEELVHEALILAKYIQNPLQEDGLLERLSQFFLERYPHLIDQEYSHLEIIRHALILTEDELLRKPKKKK